MSQPILLVDAFTSRPFSGNPAAVCIRETPADETWMKLVAREMNLSETAFLHPIQGGWSLRWLTPKVEVKLCGHATLASAFALWETGRLRPDELARFHTFSGWLTCRRAGEWIEMDFPVKKCAPCVPPSGLAEALGCDLVSCALNLTDYLVEVADEQTLRQLKPDFSALSKLLVRGVIVTCRSSSPQFDFVSRFFAPALGINEDPVTGSAHCSLGPYWKARLGRSELTAFQASERGGTVGLSVSENRVLLRGQAVLMGSLDLRHTQPA